MTSTTPFAATVTPMATKTQNAWKVIDACTPAIKGKITKAANKLNDIRCAKNKPFYDDFRAIQDANYPTRDAIIEEAKAKRDALIAQAEAEFQSVRNEAQKAYEALTQESYKEYNDRSTAHYAEYSEAWLKMVSEITGVEVSY
jgi:vacuolar-type H+-ATPase subunit H